MHAIYEFVSALNPQIVRVVLAVLGTWLMVGTALWLASKH